MTKARIRSLEQQQGHRRSPDAAHTIWHMRLVGLTGGIACGKSTVSRLLADHGFTIIDADLIARLVTEQVRS